VALGLQAPFWVVAALVVSLRLVWADHLLVVAAARSDAYRMGPPGLEPGSDGL
jgi:hypothetical protein